MMSTGRPYPANLIALAVLACEATALPLSAQRRSPVAPREEQLKAAVNEAYSMFKSDTGGKNADYIPYLAKVDPNLYSPASVGLE